MKLEELIEDLEPNEPVSISDVMIATNERLGRCRYYCDRFSMVRAMEVIEDAIQRGILWGVPEAAFVAVVKPS